MNQVSFYVHQQRHGKGAAARRLNPFMNQVSFYAFRRAIIALMGGVAS